LEAKPADRYEAIARFIDVSGVEKAESTLRELVRTLEDKRDSVAREIAGHITFLEELCTTAGEPPNRALAWAKERVATDPAKLNDVISQLTSSRDLYKRFTEHAKALRETAEAMGLA